MNIYVGNLASETSEDTLNRAFAAFGQVKSASIIRDGTTGESRGFGFVRMEVQEEAQTAIREMNEKELDGQVIKVEKGRTNVVRNRGRQAGSRGGRGGPHRRVGFGSGRQGRSRQENRGRGGRSSRGNR
ncbi:MAG: RNA-binding protein [Phycisphaerae bacterium]|nr:RNA-binding protein [Phycisphaerae bacterium]NIR67453.1 RNA-binding protein [candidate division Zixibacteria bacterium]NIP51008.1 RNA-binding protein [Phycisphaerae bacterium]NIS52740.1 RNA-binding protein [Phycisphaerae bacterium]NIU10177.1 RNA-binding protein [Phycisphaerae bacterium]